EVPGAAATFEEGDWNGDGYFTTADLVLALQEGNYVRAAQMRHSTSAELAAASLFEGAHDRLLARETSGELEPLVESELDAAFADWDPIGTLASRRPLV